MLRVALAEDHEELRTTLRMFLGLLNNIEVVFVAENGREALECVQHHQPDVLVMDILMPELDGLEVARRIANLALPTRVILISTLKAYDIEQVVKAAGGHGFVPKDEIIEMLPVAIETVSRGGYYFQADV